MESRLPFPDADRGPALVHRARGVSARSPAARRVRASGGEPGPALRSPGRAFKMLLRRSAGERPFPARRRAPRAGASQLTHKCLQAPGAPRRLLLSSLARACSRRAFLAVACAQAVASRLGRSMQARYSVSDPNALGVVPSPGEQNYCRAAGSYGGMTSPMGSCSGHGAVQRGHGPLLRAVSPPPAHSAEGPGETAVQLHRAHHHGHQNAPEKKITLNWHLPVHHGPLPLLQGEQAGLAKQHPPQPLAQRVLRQRVPATTRNLARAATGPWTQTPTTCSRTAASCGAGGTSRRRTCPRRRRGAPTSGAAPGGVKGAPAGPL